MQQKKNTDIKITIEKLKKYCAIQERCKWDIIQKIKLSQLTKKKQDNIEPEPKRIFFLYTKSIRTIDIC